MKKEEQKQHLIDMMKDDEKLGLYKETACGKLPDNMGFPHFKTGIVEQPNEIPNKENGKIYKDQHGREFFQTEHGRIMLTKQTRHIFDNINEQKINYEQY